MISIVLGRYDLAWAVGIAATATLVYFASHTPEPARTGLDLVAAVCEGDGRERAELIEAHVVATLEVWSSDGVGDEQARTLERRQLVAELLAFNAARPHCACSLEDWRTRPEDNGSQWLEGTLEYSDSQASDLHVQRRPLRALFRDVASQPRLERLVLGPIERRQPEARP